MVATGDMETGVMVREVLGAVTGALVVVVDTEVEDTPPVATETIGKDFDKTKAKMLQIALTNF